MKRFLSCEASEILKMNGEELISSIKSSDGRIILSEVHVLDSSMIPGITNAEVARSFGADLILLNGVDLFDIKIPGIDSTKDVIQKLKEYVGRPIGVNLEPIDLNATVNGEKVEISNGRQLNLKTIEKLNENGFDFVCLTGNPGTGVTTYEIANAIKLTRKYYSGVIIAGKMHSAGTNENIYDLEAIKEFILSGADIILIPSPGTVPGSTVDNCKKVVDFVKENGKLTMGGLGTSQESADISTIREIGILNKMVGFDIHHIGDAGVGGIAPVENIYELSKAIRGKRHTYKMICSSIKR